MTYKLLFGIALTLVLLSGANASGTFTAYYSGYVTTSGTGINGVSVTMTCYGGVTSNALTDSNGYYTLASRTFYYPYSGVPTCTISATHNDYVTSSQNLQTTTHTANFALNRAEKTISGGISNTAQSITGISVTGTGASGKPCSYSGTSYSCSVYSSLPFTITADTIDYHGSASNTGISTDTTGYNIPMTILKRTVSGSISGAVETITEVIVSEAGATGDACTFTNTDYSCNVYSGLQFTISINSLHYSASYQATISSDTVHDMTMTQNTFTFNVNVQDPLGTNIPGATLTMTTGSGTCSATSCTVNSGEAFTITASATNYASNTYSNTVTSNPGAQTIILDPSIYDISGIVNPATAKIYYYYTDNALHECSITSGSYTCTVYAGTPFKINATELHYDNQTRDYPSGITATTTGQDFTLTRTQYTITNIIQDINSNPVIGVTLNGNDAGFVSCIGYSCNVYSGLPFTINYSLNGYVNSTYTDTVSASKTKTTILNSTLKITLNGNPTKGTLSVTNAPTQTVNGNGPYYFIINPAWNPIEINYTDPTGRYEPSNITGFNVNDSEQTSLTLTIIENTRALTLNITNENNETISGVSVNSYYENAIHSCTAYTCNLPTNIAFNITITKAGYVKQNYTSAGININTAENITLNRTLHLTLKDDNNEPIKSGQIIINNSANTQTISTTTITNTNNAIDFYYDINPQTINVNYLGGNEYTEEITTGMGIIVTDNNQLTLALSTTRTWLTLINATNNTGNQLSDYAIIADGNTCPSQYCTLNRSAHDLVIKKAGFVKRYASVQAGNNGMSINTTLNQTLYVYVRDTNSSNIVNGEIIIINLSGTELNRVTLVNGRAWIPVNPSGNNSPATLKFNSTTYVRNEYVISAGTIKEESTTNITIDTIPLRKLTITVEDNYTNREITNANIKVFDNSQVYCTSNPCEFQMSTPPSFVNVNASANGYYSTSINNQGTSTGSLIIRLNPRAVVYANGPANVTVYNTKGTSSPEDDDFMYTMPTTNNSGVTYAGLPINNGTQFKIKVNATNGLNAIELGPYTAGNDIIFIGSMSNPINISISGWASQSGTPIITSINVLPLNPTSNDNITIKALATDEDTGKHNITMCNVKIDNGYWIRINQEYNNYIANITTSIGKINPGTHTISVACRDDVEGWGDASNTTLFVTTYIPLTSNQTNEETVTPNNVRLSILKNKYDLLAKVGLATSEFGNALSVAEQNMTNTTLNEAERRMPLLTLNGERTVETIIPTNPELIAEKIAIRESQPYTTNELKNSIKPVMFNKKATLYTLNGEPKTLITLTIYSSETNPDAIIADVNPGESNAPMTINTINGSITYFKGLEQGENVFEYVINGEINQTSEPIMFTMKELSQSEKAIKNLTGFAIGIPGILEIPVIYLGIGAIALFVILKFLI